MKKTMKKAKVGREEQDASRGAHYKEEDCETQSKHNSTGINSEKYLPADCSTIISLGGQTVGPSNIFHSFKYFSLCQSSKIQLKFNILLQRDLPGRSNDQSDGVSLLRQFSTPIIFK